MYVREVRAPLDRIFIGQPEKVSEYMTADRPETSAVLLTSQEMDVESNPNYTTNPNLSIPHITIGSILLASTCYSSHRSRPNVHVTE